MTWDSFLTWLHDWNATQGFWTATQGIGTIVAAVAALIAVFIARSQLGELVRSNTLLADSNDAMTASNVAAIRPYVTVDLDFRPALSRTGGIHEISVAVRIENVGRTPAKDLRLRLDTPFEAEEDGSTRRDFASSVEALNLLMNGESVIKTLTPRRPMIYPVGDSSSAMGSEESTPGEWSVEAAYTDAEGREFKDTFTLALAPWRLALVNVDPLQRAAKNIEGVAYEIKNKKMPSLDFEFPKPARPRILRPRFRRSRGLS
jgi:hypothetical protein